MSEPHEFGVTRLIAAPVAKVWQIMAERQDGWWCPAPWRAEVTAQDCRAGGICRMTMFGPNGEVAPQNGIYLAYDEGPRFVTTDAVTADFAWAGPFIIGIWEVTAEGDGTRYTARARHWTEESMKNHTEMGFVEGWAACAEQLAGICEREAGASA